MRPPRRMIVPDSSYSARELAAPVPLATFVPSLGLCHSADRLPLVDQNPAARATHDGQAPFAFCFPLPPGCTRRHGIPCARWRGVRASATSAATSGRLTSTGGAAGILRRASKYCPGPVEAERRRYAGGDSLGMTGGWRRGVWRLPCWVAPWLAQRSVGGVGRAIL